MTVTDIDDAFHRRAGDAEDEVRADGDARRAIQDEATVRQLKEGGAVGRRDVGGSPQSQQVDDAGRNGLRSREITQFDIGRCGEVRDGRRSMQLEAGGGDVGREVRVLAGTG